jgi:D-glycero-D-manno-heptose 1,7-bisphosphate phosphatase
MAEAELIDGVVPAVRALAAAGYACVVVTNQPDVDRGTQTIGQLSAVHRYLRSRLPLTDIYACCHAPQAGCPCRKPLPGMLFAAASRHQLDLSVSVMFGDRPCDFGAARAAGCEFFWITGDAQDGEPPGRMGPAASTLGEAVSALFSGRDVPHLSKELTVHVGP